MAATFHLPPDGATWTIKNSGTSAFLNGICYGDSLFVAVGEHGTIITSHDDSTWTIRSSGTTEFLNGITLWR